MKRIIGLLVLAPALCQATTNQLEFDYGRGTPRGSYHFGDFVTQEGPRGPEWSADFLHKNSAIAYLGVGGGHFHSGDELSDTYVPNTSSTHSLRITSILALGRLDISPNPKVTPYILIGVGWARNSLTVTSGSQVLVDDSKNTMGYAAAFGLDLALTDRLFIGGEARYQGSVGRRFDTTPAGLAATGQSQVDVPLGAFLFSAKVGMKY